MGSGRARQPRLPAGDPPAQEQSVLCPRLGAASTSTRVTTEVGCWLRYRATATGRPVNAVCAEQSAPSPRPVVRFNTMRPLDPGDPRGGSLSNSRRRSAKQHGSRVAGRKTRQSLAARPLRQFLHARARSRVPRQVPPRGLGLPDFLCGLHRTVLDADRIRHRNSLYIPRHPFNVLNITASSKHQPPCALSRIRLTVAPSARPGSSTGTSNPATSPSPTTGPASSTRRRTRISRDAGPLTAANELGWLARVHVPRTALGGDLTPASDVFSLGSLLTAGRRPPERRPQTLYNVAHTAYKA